MLLYHLSIKVKFFVICCLISAVSYSQTWNWAKGEGDIGDDVSNSVTMDENGNAYVTGNIAGRADFSGTFYQGRGLYDVFIAKYDPQGNVVWVKTAGGTADDEGKSIRYSKNFIYVTGYFKGSATFATTNLTSQGDADVFVAKYDLDGNLMWVRQASGAGKDYGSSIDVDLSGNVYVAGTYEDGLSLASTQLSTTNVYSESFFAKYDASGNLVWAKSTIGTAANLITGLAFDNHNSIFLTGYFSGNFKLNSGNLNSSSPSYDIFLAKVDENGNLQWLNRAGSTYEDASQGVCSDKDGNPSIVGYFAGTAIFGTNSVTYHDYNDIFVAHYDALGNNLWVRAGKGQKFDVGFAIASDDDGNVFAAGMFQEAINFDGNALMGVAKDMCVVSYNPNGNIRWVQKAGGTGTDCPLGIAVANSGRVAVTGYYLLNCSFGSVSVDYASATDLFIAEFTPPIPNSIKNVDDELQVSVYPNPCSDATGCKVILQNPGVSTIRVTDILGNEILGHEFSSEFNIQTSALSVGIYFVEVSSAQSRNTIKLLKE
ncbi:MAG: SBBP repeat-containing protein [Bacteroidota bacterium]